MYAKTLFEEPGRIDFMNSKTDSTDFQSVADSVFGTLLTITTILSGLYIGMAFGWFEGAIGQATTTQVLQQATIGIVVSLVFILPLILVLMAWALSKFSNSIAWRGVAWSGLIYCLAQDFIGLYFGNSKRLRKEFPVLEYSNIFFPLWIKTRCPLAIASFALESNAHVVLKNKKHIFSLAGLDCMCLYLSSKII